MALVAVCLALLAVAFIGGTDRVSLTAVFQQTSGLVPGANVSMGGAKVGRVTSIKLGPDGLPRVRMDIDRDVTLRAGAIADLRVFSNAGEISRYIALLPGSGGALPNEATIPATQTESPVELDRALSTLNPRTRSDLRGVLAALDGSTTELAGAFRKTLRTSARAFDQTGAWLQDVSADGAALKTLVSQGAALTTTLSRRRADLAGTVEQLAQTLQTAAARSRDLAAGTAALPAGLRSQTRALRQVRAATPDLERLLEATAPVARRLRPTARHLRPVLATARPVLATARRLLTDSPTDLRRLSAALREITPVARLITPVADGLVPITNFVRAYTPELLGFITSWASMASNYDANGHAIRITAIGTAVPATSADGAGVGAGYLKPPFARAPGALIARPWTNFRASFLSPAPRGTR